MKKDNNEEYNKGYLDALNDCEGVVPGEISVIGADEFNQGFNNCVRIILDKIKSLRR